MTKMRKQYYGESWASAYILRPFIHVAFYFSAESRAIRKYQRSHP